jgi:hypothetical protein
MIKAKLNVSAVLKQHLFKGEKGTYLDITLLENKNGTDQYGNDYMVVQDIGKEARERGEKGPILGNAKNWNKPTGPAKAPPAQQAKSAPREDLDEDIPF